VVFEARLRKVNDEFEIAIPAQAVSKIGAEEGDVIFVFIERVPDGTEMSPEIRASFEKSWKRNEAGYRYLADR
jgi:bifunctional DNA-binding transcriptional regulator/antitoxin component of YhaV-PrlF toxin-antitoxin module